MIEEAYQHAMKNFKVENFVNDFLVNNKNIKLKN